LRRLSGQKVPSFRALAGLGFIRAVSGFSGLVLVVVQMSSAMSAPPTHLRALKDAGLLELDWADGSSSRLPLKLLRARCPCASCVDEISGERILDPATIPETIVPVKMGFSGNYALKITWSDGHSTGLYTWDLLAEIARCTKSN
jgi:DUF971 family protein